MVERGHGAFGNRTRQKVILVQKRDGEARVWPVAREGQT